jgi:hypothetical protein
MANRNDQSPPGVTGTPKNTPKSTPPVRKPAGTGQYQKPAGAGSTKRGPQGRG